MKIARRPPTMRPMQKIFACSGALLVSAFVAGGCGGSALQTAAAHIAALNGCEAAQVTVLETSDGYEALGCGEPARYQCTAQECAAAEGEASVVTERARAAQDVLRGLEADVLACADGEPVAAQILFAWDGHPDNLQLAPDPGGDVRRCVGLLVLPVRIPAGPPVLLSHRFGGPVSETEIATPMPAIDEGDVAEHGVEDTAEDAVEEPVGDDDLGEDVPE